MDLGARKQSSRLAKNKDEDQPVSDQRLCYSPNGKYI